MKITAEQFSQALIRSTLNEKQCRLVIEMIKELDEENIQKIYNLLIENIKEYEYFESEFMKEVDREKAKAVSSFAQLEIEIDQFQNEQ